MKIYELNYWEGPGDHKTWLFTDKKKALDDADAISKNTWVTEVWLRVWESKGGLTKILENAPLYQK